MPADRPGVASFLGGQAFFVMLGYGFTFAVGFPLQIFIARTLGPTELGYFSLVEAVTGIATGLMGFGIAATVVKFVPDHLAKGEHDEVRRLVRRATIILTVSGVTAATVIGLASGPLAHLLAADAAPGFSAAIAVASVVVPLSLILYLLQQALRGFFDLRYAMIGSSIIQLATKALVAVVLLGIGLRLMGLVLAVIAAQFAAVVWMARGVALKLSRLPPGTAAAGLRADDRWRAYAGNQYKRFLATLAVGYIDRFLLSAMAGASSVGVLAVLQQLQTLPAVCLEMLLTVVTPAFAAAHANGDDDQGRRIFHLTTDWVVRAAAPLVIFFIVFASPVLRLYGDAFAREGATALVVLMTGQMLNLVLGPTTTYLNMCGREAEFLKIHVWAQAVYVVCLAGLVPLLGIVGAVLARFASSLFANLAALHVAVARTALVWWDDRFRRWLLPSAATIVVAIALSGTLGDAVGAVRLILALGALVGTFHAVYLLQGLSDDDRELLLTVSRRFKPVAGA